MRTVQASSSTAGLDESRLDRKQPWKAFFQLTNVDGARDLVTIPLADKNGGAQNVTTRNANAAERSFWRRDSDGVWKELLLSLGEFDTTIS